MRRYIGERYVPIVDGAWDITKTYEPLTMVSNSNNIYISKNYVPAGVNISDTDYWALMMDYSSIIAELTEVHDDLGDIDDASAVTGNSAFAKINTLNTDLTTVVNRMYPISLVAANNQVVNYSSRVYYDKSHNIVTPLIYFNVLSARQVTHNVPSNITNILTPTVCINTSTKVLYFGGYESGNIKWDENLPSGAYLMTTPFIVSWSN